MLALLDKVELGIHDDLLAVLQGDVANQMNQGF